MLFLYTFVLLFFTTKLSPLYPSNEWSDLNLYFNIGKGILNGRTLYTEIFDHKGPFIFFLYGFGYLISNTSFFGVYLLFSLFWVAAVFAAYRTARLFLNQMYSFLVALAFPVLSLSHTMSGGSADELIALLAAVSLYYFVLYFKEKNNAQHNPYHMLIHGIMCGIVLMTKLNLLVFWFFPLIAILITILRNKEYQNLWKNIIAYIIGLLIIVLPICIYLLFNNALKEGYEIYITLNSKYSGLNTMSEAMGYLAIRFYQRLRFDTIEFIIILIGAIYFPIRFIKNRIGGISLILSFIALYIMIFMAKYFHYYSVPYYIFTIPGLIVIGNYLRKYIEIKYAIPICLFFCLIGIGVGIQYKNYFDLDTEELFRRKEIVNVETQFRKKILAEKENPTLVVLGLNTAVGIFTYADITPNIKYFAAPNLSYDFYPEMRDEQSKYIENKEVDFVVLTDYSFDYDYFKYYAPLINNYTLIDTFLEDNFKTYYLFERNDLLK